MELRLALVERIHWVDGLWEVGVYDWGFSAQFFSSLLRRGQGVHKAFLVLVLAFFFCQKPYSVRYFSSVFFTIKKLLP